VSRLLEPDEREVVRGDITELRISSRQALVEILGLIARRQIQLWTGWRPWAAVVGLAVPLGTLLGCVSRSWTDWSSIHAWLYVDNWTWGYLASAGSRHQMVTVGVDSLTQCLTLACWSWTIGFALGSLSRRTAWTSAALFGLVSLGGTLGIASAAALNPANAVVFAVTFYRVALPIMLCGSLVWLPAIAGLQRSLRSVPLPLEQAIAWAAAVFALTMNAGRSVGMSVVVGWWAASAEGSSVRGLMPGPDSWLLRLLPLAMLWPVAYVVATAIRQRRHKRAING